MSGLAVALAVPAGVGNGAASSVLAMGIDKTIVVDGVIPEGAVITVEVSAGGSRFAPLKSFIGPGPHLAVVQVAADELRVNVQGVAAAAATVDVAGSDGGSRVGVLAVPGADGVGAALDVTTFGVFKTAVCVSALPFDGTLTVEFSPDNVNFAPGLPSFDRGSGGEVQSGTVPALFARVRRQGFSAAAPGSPPTIDLAGSVDPATGGGLIQAFTYTVTGAEPDLSDFVVPLPAARVNDDYVVTWGLGGVSVIFGVDAPDLIAGDRTTAQFRVVLSQPAVVGDKIDFIIMDRG
jgi:hypothetical protein